MREVVEGSVMGEELGPASSICWECEAWAEFAAAMVVWSIAA